MARGPLIVGFILFAISFFVGAALNGTVYIVGESRILVPISEHFPLNENIYKIMNSDG